MAVGVGLAALLGLVLRLAYLERTKGQSIGGDGFAYLVESANAVNGEWYSSGRGPIAHHPPGWSTVLSSFRVFFGIDSVLGLQRATAVIGTLTVVAVAVLGRRVAGRRTGLSAAVIAALYPGMWVLERALLSEPLALLFVTAMMWAFYRLIDEPGVGWALVTATMVVLAGITRAELMGAGAILICWIWWRSGRSTGVRVQMMAVCAIPLVVLVGPWVAFNHGRFEEPVLLSTGLGGTMLAGACDHTFEGERFGYFDNRCSLRRLVAERDKDRSELDIFARGEAIAYSREHLSRLPAVVLAREARTFGLYRPFQDARLTADWARSDVRPLQSWVVGYLFLLPFGIAGAVILRRRGRPIFPLLVPVVLIAFATSFTFGQLRYRTVAEASLVVLAAVAFAEISRHLRAAGRGRPVSTGGGAPAAVGSSPAND